MPSQSFITGLLEGFNQRAEENRRNTRADEDEQFRRESAILETLVKSSDPEIAQAAVSALAERAVGGVRPKGGFLQRIIGLGPQSIHPAVQHVLNLVNTPVAVPGTPARAGVPAPQARQAPSGASMAMPARAATQPGGGPASPGQLAGPPPVVPNAPTATMAAPPPPPPSLGGQAVVGFEPGQLEAAPQTGELASRQTRPRKIFLTPDEQAYQTRISTERADVEGEVQGWMAVGKTRQEAIELVREGRMRRAGLGAGAGTLQSIAGELADGSPAFAAFDKRPGSPTYGQYIDPNTQSPIPGFKPRTSVGSTSMGQVAERLARGKYGKPFAQLDQAEAADINDQVLEFQRSQSFERGVGSGQAAAIAPLTVQQRANQETSMHSDFQRFTNDANTALNMVKVVDIAYESMKRNYEAGKPIGAQQQAVVQSFGRLIDTLSSVREAEYERTPEGQSLWNRFQGELDKLKQGGAGLAMAEVENVVNLARAIAEGRKTYILNQAAVARNTARTYGLNEQNILPPDVIQMLGGLQGGPPPAAPVTTLKPPTIGGGTPPPAAPGTTAPAATPTPTLGGPRVGQQVGSPRVGEQYQGELRRAQDGGILGIVNGVRVELTTMDGGKTWHILRVHK